MLCPLDRLPTGHQQRARPPGECAESRAENPRGRRDEPQTPTPRLLRTAGDDPSRARPPSRANAPHGPSPDPLTSPHPATHPTRHSQHGRDVARFSLVNRRARRLCEDDDVWRELCARHFDIRPRTATGPSAGGTPCTRSTTTCSTRCSGTGKAIAGAGHERRLGRGIAVAQAARADVHLRRRVKEASPCTKDKTRVPTIDGRHVRSTTRVTMIKHLLESVSSGPAACACERPSPRHRHSKSLEVPVVIRLAVHVVHRVVHFVGHHAVTHHTPRRRLSHRRDVRQRLTNQRSLSGRETPSGDESHVRPRVGKKAPGTGNSGRVVLTRTSSSCSSPWSDAPRRRPRTSLRPRVAPGGHVAETDAERNIRSRHRPQRKTRSSPPGTFTVPEKEVFNTLGRTRPADAPGHDVDGGSRRDGFLRGLRPVRGAASPRHPRGIPVASLRPAAEVVTGQRTPRCPSPCNPRCSRG